MQTRRCLHAASLAVMLAMAATTAGGAPPAAPRDRSADIAVRWFTLLHDMIKDERLAPPVAARVIGYAGVTLHEAIVGGAPSGRSLAGQLNGLDALPSPDGRGRLDRVAAASSALAGTLRGLFADAAPATLLRIDGLESAVRGEARGFARSKVYRRSVEYGRAVADAILDWADGDGADILAGCPYTPPAGDGLWVPTPPGYKPALEPCWGQVRTFALTSGGECAPPPHPPYSTDPASTFWAEAMEVHEVWEALTTEQMTIAMYWSDDPGPAGTPPGHWISILNQVAQRDDITLDQAGEAYARLGIALADAFIACWSTKFQMNLLRPVTYIRDNIDPAWMPMVGTPPFPEFTSGHSVQSGAAAAILTSMLGTVAFTDHTHDARGFAPRSFASFEEAAEEAAVSRLYGGIHYRSAIDLGVDQGRCIAAAIDDRVSFHAP